MTKRTKRHSTYLVGIILAILFHRPLPCIRSPLRKASFSHLCQRPVFFEGCSMEASSTVSTRDRRLRGRWLPGLLRERLRRGDRPIMVNTKSGQNSEYERAAEKYEKITVIECMEGLNRPLPPENVRSCRFLGCNDFFRISFGW